MEFIFIIIVIIVVVIRNLGKTKDGSGSSSAANRTPQASSQAYRYAQSRTQQTANRYSTSSNAGSFGRTQAARGRTTPSVNQRDGRVYASIDFDNTHYHAEGFDFDCCISFKGLPPGTDELAVLIASNNRHERELSKLLQVRES